jgi:hypothetical protein
VQVQVAITEQRAHDMGAKGAEPTEAERLLFEAWMRGHCWKVTGQWNGKTYVHEAEHPGGLLPSAMNTRQLWAAWRDRAALSTPPAAQRQPVVPEGYALVDIQALKRWGVYDYVVQACQYPITAPPQRQPLTDEWIRSMCKETWAFETVKQWVRIAEAAHGIKGEA